MRSLFLLSLILGTALAPISSSQEAGPKITRAGDDWEEDWVYSTPWFDYQVHSRFTWTWTEWNYSDGSWKAKYEFREWSRALDRDGKQCSWNNNVVRIYNERSGVYVVAEEWGDPWTSHQIIKRVKTGGVVRVEFNRYTVSKPPT
jgi:hypothetical protein